MKSFINAFFSQIEIIFSKFPEHFRESPISTIFLIFIVLTLFLNIIKRTFVWCEKKRGTPHLSCEYLVDVENGQDCDHPSYRNFFEMNEGCTGCRGKSFKMTDEEAERRIAKGDKWKYIIILGANCSKSVLPYISFFYTLAIATFGNNK